MNGVQAHELVGVPGAPGGGPLLRWVLVAVVVLASGSARAGEGGTELTMAPIWAASAVQLIFALMSGVGLALYHRAQKSADDRHATMDRRVELLERRLADTREEYARRAELEQAGALVRQELGTLRGLLTTQIERQEAKVDAVRTELHQVHQLLTGGRHG